MKYFEVNGKAENLVLSTLMFEPRHWAASEDDRIKWQASLVLGQVPSW